MVWNLDVNGGKGVETDANYNNLFVCFFFNVIVMISYGLIQFQKVVSGRQKLNSL